MFLALRQTQKAGGARFTQTLTFESEKGRAVQTTSGRLDFAGGTGEARVTWSVPKEYPDAAKAAMLGSTPGRTNADASGSFLVDRQAIRYRAGSADYWLRYTVGDDGATAGSDAVDRLLGTESPIGGTLLEGIGGAEATAGKTEGQGRTYRAEMPATVAWELFPQDLRDELTVQGMASSRTAPLPLTVSVDGRGRIVHALVDLASTLGRKGSALHDVTSLRMDLTLSAHGTAAPSSAAPQGPTREANDAVLRLLAVKAGKCVDFGTGLREARMVVSVPCSGPHDGRVFDQLSLGKGAFPGGDAAQKRARRACRGAYDGAPSGWTSESAEKDTYWYMWSGESDWRESGEGRVTCYVVTREGAA
ncbi:hypothetical protein [Streptomyces sp. NPDC048338]|uniref:hypothetical protein n=1 Tax=Streptomyces sp. NPDC048338 TaxID=3365536 RepID=UPI00371091E1